VGYRDWNFGLEKTREVHAEKTTVTSEATVERSQFEVTAWPKDGDLEHCFNEWIGTRSPEWMD